MRTYSVLLFRSGEFAVLALSLGLTVRMGHVFEAMDADGDDALKVIVQVIGDPSAIMVFTDRIFAAHPDGRLSEWGHQLVE